MKTNLYSIQDKRSCIVKPPIQTRFIKHYRCFFDSPLFPSSTGSLSPELIYAHMVSTTFNGVGLENELNINRR